jgi:hypothetical protein
VAWAFDGSKNFITAQHVQLRGGVDMPHSNQVIEVTVRDVPEAAKGKLTDWQVCCWRYVFQALLSLHMVRMLVSSTRLTGPSSNPQIDTACHTVHLPFDLSVICYLTCLTIVSDMCCALQCHVLCPALPCCAMMCCATV